MDADTVSGRLYLAVKNGDLKEVVEILAFATADEVNQREGNYNERTALAEAVVSRNLDIVRAILGHPGLDVNLPNKHNVLPLMSSYTAEMTQLLLSHPAVDANTLGKERSFRLACDEGNLEIVRVFLAHGGFDINAQNDDGVTALIYAANQSSDSIMQALLAQPDIDVNIQDATGFSALLYACFEQDSPAVLPLLLAHPSTNINQRQENGHTALSLACMAGLTKTVSILLKVPNIDVNVPNYSGHTPLLKAADKGYTEICTMLLNHPDVDANAQSQDGFTALICAAQHGHADVVRALLDFACLRQSSCAAHNKWTSVNPVISTECVQAILRNRIVDVNLRNIEGYSALLIACENQYIDIVKLLLVVPGININVENEFGHSSLTMAAFKGNVEIVQLLLAIPTFDINKGRYPPLLAACASREGNLEVVKLLLAHPRIDVNARARGEEGGGTALWLACNLGQTEIVRYMLSVCDTFDLNAAPSDTSQTLIGCAANEEIREILRVYIALRTNID